MTDKVDAVARLTTLSATAQDARVWIGNLGSMADQFVAALAAIKNETRELEENHKQKMEAARLELERANTQIAEARKLHRQMEASIASLRAEKQKILDRLNGVLRKPGAAA